MRSEPLQVRVVGCKLVAGGFGLCPQPPAIKINSSGICDFVTFYSVMY